MSSVPWVRHPKDDQLDVLPVPTLAHEESENKCLVFCLWMAIHYFANSYPDSWVNGSVSAMRIEDIEQHLSLTASGWKPDTSDLKTLSEEVGPVQFKHTLQKNPPSQGTLLTILEDHLDQAVPVIPIVNARKLRRNRKGGVHAVVVTGINEECIAINDPWGYLYDIVDKERFVGAWNDTINQYITVEIGGQQTMEDPDNNGGEL